MKKLLSTLLAACMLLSVASCSNSGAANRETTVAVTGDTKTTVNPDVSEPNQSIPSDAMITETETESTAPVKNGNTYTINGVEFTISVHIEDYLYDLPGSDAKYIDLDKFMEAYGFKSNAKWPEERCSYSNDTGMGVNFNWQNAHIYSAGLPVCTDMSFIYPADYSKDGSIGLVTMSSDYPLDKENHVYVVNGSVEDGKRYEKYCVSQEMLVALATAFDAMAETGSTAPAVELLARACYWRDEGAYGTQSLVIK
ncbi:hypothetical protein [Butyrivibrio sp. AE2032]|uniref:hypothetical protein n=1 Tax=Butyrivibrio sp. AE2032 TaxID=1458463 RepID=UPI000A4B2415|nr:hypothetical protein [Butyrivibrio sp. AE2032]